MFGRFCLRSFNVILNLFNTKIGDFEKSNVDGITSILPSPFSDKYKPLFSSNASLPPIVAEINTLYFAFSYRNFQHKKSSFVQCNSQYFSGFNSFCLLTCSIISLQTNSAPQYSTAVIKSFQKHI